jgi:hypothetical protein
MHNRTTVNTELLSIVNLIHNGTIVNTELLSIVNLILHDQWVTIITLKSLTPNSPNP